MISNFSNGKWLRGGSPLFRFVVVGLLATGIHYSILVALTHWAGVDPILSSSLGFVTSAAVNYLLSYYFTFRSSVPHVHSMLRFVLVSSVGLFLNWACMTALVSAGLHYLFAQVGATSAVISWSFLANRRWTFEGASQG